ncbi:uncharacterized protein LOC133927965 [Phragmites australis]|uniref:uncharacterized protein LOC133927965 n=1 Tax=Phragmites australis TaxID=29695 RepID=UPI002D791F0B|nr:uncharacterized protein LOC133927965 [Phragmites australis]
MAAITLTARSSLTSQLPLPASARLDFELGIEGKREKAESTKGKGSAKATHLVIVVFVDGEAGEPVVLGAIGGRGLSRVPPRTWKAMASRYLISNECTSHVLLYGSAFTHPTVEDPGPSCPCLLIPISPRRHPPRSHHHQAKPSADPSLACLYTLFHKGISIKLFGDNGTKHSAEMSKLLENENQAVMGTYRAMSHELHKLQHKKDRQLEGDVVESTQEGKQRTES